MAQGAVKGKLWLLDVRCDGCGRVGKPGKAVAVYVPAEDPRVMMRAVVFIEDAMVERQVADLVGAGHDEPRAREIAETLRDLFEQEHSVAVCRSCRSETATYARAA